MAERQQPSEERSTTGESQSSSGSPQQAEAGASEQIELEARSRANEMKEQAKSTARELGHEAEERAQRWASSVGHQAESLARALRVASDSLWTEGEERMASVVSQAAEQVDRMSGYLEDEDPSAMLDDLADLGRRNPGAFLGSAFAVGLAAGRFLRASSPNGGERSHARARRERESMNAGATAGAYTAPGAASPTPTSGETTVEASPEGRAGTERRS